MSNETPAAAEEVWGVELDSFGSVDYYDSEDDARTDAKRYGARLVHVTTEFYEVS